jgi:hypothetical protein
VSLPRAVVQHAAELRADAAITADRAETKYLLGRNAVRAFVQLASAKLHVHRFVGEGANLLPDAHHYVTSIYFDSPSFVHYRAAVADAEHNVKIRAREYYDLMPSLAELATDPGQIVRYQPWVWFEVKRRVEGRSQKLRFRLDKHDVPQFFCGEVEADPTGRGRRLDTQEAPELVEARGASAREQRIDARAEIVAYLRTLDEPLVPSCIVNYRRLALQDATANLRVTIDVDVGFYAVPHDLWTRSTALVRGTFGSPAGSEPSALVEVKCAGPTPAWIERELTRLGVRAVSYSKFVHAARAVHG